MPKPSKQEVVNFREMMDKIMELQDQLVEERENNTALKWDVAVLEGKYQSLKSFCDNLLGERNLNFIRVDTKGEVSGY